MLNLKEVTMLRQERGKLSVRRARQRSYPTEAAVLAN